MGICVTKTNKEKPANLIRLIKIENENTIPKSLTLFEIQTKTLNTWFKMDEMLNQLVSCKRTIKIIQFKKTINQILMAYKINNPMNDVTLGLVLELMEKIAFLIEELIREELLTKEVSTKFYQFYTQIVELSLEYSNWKNNSTTDKTQLSSFI
ncbi:unnamed protein product [Paramecium sonneborni]|uniref:Uncharacterized protein n=1 Tax=Paramecium sonneborni TaxID=65129 RepID=A0A8S1QJX4_9CILI|nr:unnamed protein product [Paramecium sonneborni]